MGSRADRNAFIRFPWCIYDNDPAWVPPLIIERKAFLNRKRHPFYQHGDAALFLARQNQKIVGRIMASDDPNYNAVHHSNVGCFGLFECIDDRKVAAALFDAAEGWLRRKGRREIMGPIDYLDQLPLRAIDRWFSISAHHSHSAQPTVLRRANRRMWLRKENRFLCVVVQRRDQSRGPVAQVGDKITNREAVYNPAR